MGLIKDNDLIMLEDKLIKAKKLKIESNKRKKRVKEKKEDLMTKYQQYDTMTKIIN